jgi:hypothetical protein
VVAATRANGKFAPAQTFFRILEARPAERADKTRTARRSAVCRPMFGVKEAVVDGVITSHKRRLPAFSTEFAIP